MVQRLWGLFVTISSGILCAYWMVWACLIYVFGIETLLPLLDREYARLRRLCLETSPDGSRLLQWLDYRAFAAWYKTNRPFFVRFTRDREDWVSAMGRIPCVETPAWVLARGPVGPPVLPLIPLARRWKA